MEHFRKARLKIEWLVFPGIALCFILLTLYQVLIPTINVRGEFESLSCSQTGNADETRYTHLFRLKDGRKYAIRSDSIECWAVLYRPQVGQLVDLEIFPPYEIIGAKVDNEPIFPERLRTEYNESTERLIFGSVFWIVCLIFMYFHDQAFIRPKIRKFLDALRSSRANTK